MLMRTDPFRDLDRLTQQVFGTMARPAAMPMDAYRKGDTFYIKLDLPGITLDAIELTVEQNVLTVHAARPGTDGEVGCWSPSAPPGPLPGRCSSVTPWMPSTSTPTTPPGC